MTVDVNTIKVLTFSKRPANKQGHRRVNAERYERKSALNSVIMASHLRRGIACANAKRHAGGKVNASTLRLGRAKARASGESRPSGYRIFMSKNKYFYDVKSTCASIILKKERN